MVLYDRLRFWLSTRGPTLTFRLHMRAYRMSGGRLFGTSGRMPILLLTTTGRKTGQPRTQPLSYLRDGERLVLIASNCGRPVHPAWYVNLLAKPSAVIQIGSRRSAVTATIAPPGERERLFAAAAALDPLYRAYATGTARQIPVVLLREV